jgi:hypothetical protein
VTNGFPVKRSYPGAKGLYFEFFNRSDADGFYQKGLKLGSRIEKQDPLTVIMKFSGAAESPH